MKGIMFNSRYGLEQAVLRGDKTRTWRADKNPRYKVGEIVAIKQCYKHIITNEPKEWLYDKGLLANLPFEGEIMPLAYLYSAGYNNKMFVPAALMPHQIIITEVIHCRVQNASDLDIIDEGIKFLKEIDMYYFDNTILDEGFYFYSAQQAFASLINKINGKGFWERNPNGFAYKFKLLN